MRSWSRSPTDVTERSQNSPMYNASHWRQDGLYRIFLGWPPQRRNGIPTDRVATDGPKGAGVRCFGADTQETPMPVWGRTALPALLAAAVAASAGAQQKACEIDEGSPNQVARAMLDLQIAQSSGKPDDAANKLKDAVKLLGEADKAKNPVGRNMVLGRTLVLWMGQPTMASGV